MLESRFHKAHEQKWNSNSNGKVRNALQRKNNSRMNSAETPLLRKHNAPRPNLRPFPPSQCTPPSLTHLRPPNNIHDVPNPPLVLEWVDDESVASSSRELFDTVNRTLKLPNIPLTPLRPFEDLPKDFSEEEYASALVHGRGIHTPYIHPQTHGIPVASIHFRSRMPQLLTLFTHFTLHAASSLGIPTSKVYGLPTRRMWTVLKGPFAHKNFERRVYQRGIRAYDAHPEVMELLVRYLERHQMGGVGLRVVRWDRMALGGSGGIALNAGKKNGQVKEEIRKLGKKIIDSTPKPQA